jgi:hypothetical protein
VDKSLTQWLKEIGDEDIEIFVKGEPVFVTKNEALARKMFLLAQGGIERIRTTEGELVDIHHKPDHKVAKTIREWTEGKAAQEPPKEEKKQVAPGQYNSEVARRLQDRLGGGTPEPEPEPADRPAVPRLGGTENASAD